MHKERQKKSARGGEKHRERMSLSRASVDLAARSSSFVIVDPAANNNPTESRATLPALTDHQRQRSRRVATPPKASTLPRATQISRKAKAES